MRKANDGGLKQAIRYKFTVSNAVKENGISGYELVEYGAVAASSAWLSQGELPGYDYKAQSGTVTSTGKNSVAGAAYNEAGKDLHSEVTEDYLVYTCALYNMGYSSSKGTTNYAKWNDDYIVRPYAVFYNQSEDHYVTYYGNAASASVFAVMNAILNSDSANAVDDKAYVNGLLDNEEILAEYLTAGYNK